jgi:hypothetical protein
MEHLSNCLFLLSFTSFGYMLQHAIIHALVYGMVFKIMYALGLKGAIVFGVVGLIVAWFFFRNSSRSRYR